AHGPAGRVRDAHAAQRGQELGAVLGVAAAGLERRAQHAARDVGALRIVGRHLLVLGLVGLHEAPVGRRLQRRRIWSAVTIPSASSPMLRKMCSSVKLPLPIRGILPLRPASWYWRQAAQDAGGGSGGAR